MGGFGSGRKRRRTRVDDCRILDLGLLCDGGALLAFPRGELVWKRALRAWLPEGVLAYCLARFDHGLVDPPHLAYVYWPRAGASGRHLETIALRGGDGRPYLARCPRCGRAARKLYAPPGAERFLCRTCYRLVYPASAKVALLREYGELVGPLLRQLAAPLSVSDLGTVDCGPLDLDDLWPEERRLACLLLRRRGLSYRQIAAEVGSSKSSVARICAAGQAGIDLPALLGERRRRSYQTMSLNQLARELKRHGLYGWANREAEVRLLYCEGAEGTGSESLATPDESARCFARLCEQYRRRLAREWWAGDPPVKRR